MNRRGFLRFLAAVPLLGKLVAAEDICTYIEPKEVIYNPSNKEEFIKNGKLMSTIRSGYQGVLRASYITLKSQYWPGSKIMLNRKVVFITVIPSQNKFEERREKYQTRHLRKATESGQAEVMFLLYQYREQEWNTWVSSPRQMTYT